MENFGEKFDLFERRNGKDQEELIAEVERGDLEREKNREIEEWINEKKEKFKDQLKNAYVEIYENVFSERSFNFSFNSEESESCIIRDCDKEKKRMIHLVGESWFLDFLKENIKREEEKDKEVIIENAIIKFIAHETRHDIFDIRIDDFYENYSSEEVERIIKEFEETNRVPIELANKYNLITYETISDSESLQGLYKTIEKHLEKDEGFERLQIIKELDAELTGKIIEKLAEREIKDKNLISRIVSEINGEKIVKIENLINGGEIDQRDIERVLSEK